MDHSEQGRKSSTDTEDSQTRSRSSISRRSVLTSSAIAGTVGLIGLPASAVSSAPSEHDGQSSEFDSQIVTGEDGMVVSRHSHASNIGAAVLRDGGNAIDAAVAVHFAVEVVNPQSIGMGGGGTMVYYDANEDEVTSLDFYLRAPDDATPEYWLDDEGNPLSDELINSSGLSVAVPGTVKGLEHAHERYGSLPWERLVTPSADLARGGFVVDEVLAEAIGDNWDRFNDAARETFCGPDGSPLQAGELIRRGNHADTLEIIREEGASGFYEGEVAEAIVDTVQRHEGRMTLDDLRDREAWFREPTHGEYRGLDIYNPPLPITAGFLVPRILKQLERFDLGENYGVQSWQKHHLFAESTALAWADRAEYLGDPDYADVPVEGLQDERFIEERGAQISLDSTLANYREGECAEPGDPWAYQNGNGNTSGNSGRATNDDSESGNTTHFAVADADGNVVAVTSSIQWGMGSGIMVPEYGFMLNNYLNLFGTEPGEPNEPEGGKAPLSSTSATIVMKDGEPFMTSGSPTGTTIPQTTAQVILNVVEYGMDIYEAVVEPRITTSHCPPIDWEAEVNGQDGIPEEARTRTAELGHVWADEPSEIGSANNLLVRDGTYFGGADPRRDSVAVGVSDIDEDDGE